MTLAPLFAAPIAVQFHVATVIPAAVLGAYLLWARKGTPRHRLLGKVWLALMVVTAISTFFISEIRLIGPFSPIHAISIFVLVEAVLAYRAARAHNIRAHQRYVVGMYLFGIIGAGVFTLLPHRLMNKIVLDDLQFGVAPRPSQLLMLVLVTGIIVGLVYIAWRAARRRVSG